MRGRPERRLSFLHLAATSGKASIFAVCHYGGAAWRLRARGPAATAAAAVAAAGPHSVRLYPRSIMLIYPRRLNKNHGRRRKKCRGLSNVAADLGGRHEFGGISVSVFNGSGSPEARRIGYNSKARRDDTE